ncbi:transglycosylase SLT domain-containing protein [Thalassoporum mexicanum]|nr:transglycosylase SLT domain-containing protein [Pseudanabaena sp. PCC 7367]
MMQWSLLVALGLTGAGVGVHHAITGNSTNPEADVNLAAIAKNISTELAQPSAYDPLTSLTLAQRISQFQQRADAPEASLDRSRARYVLANIFLENGNPQEALSLLENLEAEYPPLKAYILLKRATAHTAAFDQANATTVWNQILTDHGNQAVAAEALVALGRYDEVMTRFPNHPKARDVAIAKLKQNPNQFEPMILLAVYFNDYDQIVPILNRLSTAYKSRLNADYWSAIAAGYWNNREYGKASIAYSYASPSAVNTYRFGRSLHISGKKWEAYSIYNRVVQQFPNSPQAPRALIRMAKIAKPKDALTITDRIIASYPDTAPEAKLIKAELLQNELGSPKTASIVRNALLSKYGQSDAAAELLWKLANQQAKAGNLTKAVELVDRIKTSAPHTEIAPEAIYWSGKWLTKMGKQAQARLAYEFVLQYQPESYYAWRSANKLGWPVGDFHNARNLSLPLQIPTQRSVLPTGSVTLKELHLLAQDQDAIAQWQFETRGKELTTVDQMFTDGVLRVAINDNLEGIFQLDSFDWIDVSAAEQQRINTLKEHPAFWYTLYPFPYWDSVTNWSAQRQLSPTLVLGLIRQESRFESQIRSSAGATGLMQVMPDTGAWIAGKTGITSYSLSNPEDNIKMGTWYLDYTHREYGNNSMLAVASYNAGPGAVARWVNQRSLSDPDVFVQQIPYSETRGYVVKVFGNYWNYLRLYSPAVQQRLVQLEQQNTQVSTVPSPEN